MQQQKFPVKKIVTAFYFIKYQLSKYLNQTMCRPQSKMRVVVKIICFTQSNSTFFLKQLIHSNQIVQNYIEKLKQTFLKILNKIRTKPTSKTL